MEAFFPYLDLSGFGGKFSRFITMFKVLQTQLLHQKLFACELFHSSFSLLV